MQKIVLDFETASACDLTKCGAARYSEDITTEVISLSFSEGGTVFTWTPNMAIGNRLFYLIRDPDINFVAHNSGFEKYIWRNILVKQYDWPDIPNDRWEDTAAVCAMKALPIKLERAILALRLSNHKDTEGSRITKGLSKPDKKGRYNRDPAILERVYAYNRQDLLATVELLARIGELTEAERKVWLLDQTINERGINLDLEFITAAQKVVDDASAPLVEEFRSITGGLKPTQTAKFKEWINARGVKLDSLNKEALAQILGSEDEDNDGDEDSNLVVPDLPPMVRRALVIRSLVASASVKKLRRMQLCVCMDGRARGLLQYHGAGPGRWAGRLLQPHNFPRGTIKDSAGEKFGANVTVPAIMSGDHTFVACTVGEPIETVVSSLRHAIKAPPGHILLSGDFATIEARIVLAVAGQQDKLDILEKGQDIYCDMARSIYRTPVDKKKDPEKRQTGKNAVLGLGFQMGWKKFKSRYAKHETDGFCENIVNTYRQTWAACVPRVWRELEKAALEAVNGAPCSAYGVEYRVEDSWLTARLPSGRKLWYFDPRPTVKEMPWDKLDIRPSWTYRQMKKGQLATVDAFGGLLTENVVQGLARDLMVHAMFKLEANGFPIVLTVHDEIVAEPLTELADEKAFAEIMQDRPQWAKELQIPVAVETWKDERYRK